MWRPTIVRWAYRGSIYIYGVVGERNKALDVLGKLTELSKSLPVPVAEFHPSYVRVPTGVIRLRT